MALVLVFSLPSIAVSYQMVDTDIHAIDEILVEEDSITLAGVEFTTVPTVRELSELLGRPDRVTELLVRPSRAGRLKPTKIYTWDLLGLYVYVFEGEPTSVSSGY